VNDFPETWHKTVLSEIAYIEMGQSPPSSSYNDQGNGLPFFQGKAEFGKIYPTVQKWCTEPKKIAEANDILISVRAPVGPTNLASEKCCIGRGLAAIRAYPSLNQKYLLHHFRNIEPWLGQQGTGTTFKAISKSFIQSLEVPLAPLNEQKRIADKLDSLLQKLDTCQVHLDRVPQIIERFRQSVLAEAVSGQLTKEWREKNPENPGYRKVTLAETGSKTMYGTSAKSRPEGEVPVLRMGNIQDGRLDWNDLVFTSDHDEIEKYKLYPGDVLFNRTNSPELVGKTAVYKGERTAIPAGYLIRVRCGSELLPDYLSYCLNSPYGLDWRWRVKSDGVNQSNINATKLAAFEFNLPSIEEQKEIVHQVESLLAYSDQMTARYQAGKNCVDLLTPSLLAKAFRGELVEQDPNDEPASVLLERVKAERAAAKAEKPKRVSKSQKIRSTKMTKDSVREAIQSFPEDEFSFDELREKISGDYEQLKSILFNLLSEKEPIIEQVFDPDTRSMLFIRRG
jgi:type I restriction enzyme S subunit